MELFEVTDDVRLKSSSVTAGNASGHSALIGDSAAPCRLTAVCCSLRACGEAALCYRTAWAIRTSARPTSEVITFITVQERSVCGTVMAND